jgi:peptidoglycan/xylan/chitin deacetylase (PgdA/CDA1 family)
MRWIKQPRYLSGHHKGGISIQCKKLLLLSASVLALIIGIGVYISFCSNSSIETGASEENIRLPIIMYHGIMNEPGRWGTYVISADELEHDLKYIKANGYKTVTVQDIVDYVYDGKALPEKPIMLTFDDGYYNNYLYAFPLLKKYEMKAVISIIGKYTDIYSLTIYDDPIYSHVTWDQIIEMVESGFVEIQNHSYNMHIINKERVASMKARGESEEHYRTVLISDTIKLQSSVDNYTGQMPIAFAYPFGSVSKDSIEILKEVGFKSTFTCYAGINTITSDPECLYLLKRLLRPHGKSISKLLEKYN